MKDKIQLRLANNIAQRKYYNKNRQIIKQRRQEFFKNNKEYIQNYRKQYNKKYKQKNKKYYDNYNIVNREKISQRQKEYYQNNKEKIILRGKKYRQDNKEMVAKKKKIYDKKNKEKNNLAKRKYYNNKLKHNPEYRLMHNLRQGLYDIIKSNKNRLHMLELIGCSKIFLIKYIEKQFITNMNWNNYGNGINCWCIDHIIPCKSFNLLDPEEQKKCFHYSNLRPLWFSENSSKGAKVIYKLKECSPKYSQFETKN